VITFGLNYDVKEEFKEQFIKISRDVLKAMPGMKGHVKTVLYSNVDDPDSFLIYSEWETNEDFKDFVTSQAFKDVQNMSIDMLKNRPKHQIYETRKMH
jgi:heme-degrading monooxygenase HmoA